MALVSLGIINLTTGTAVRLTSLAPAKYLDNLPVVSFRVQACPDNASPVYVGGAAMEASPQGPDLLGVIPKPVSASTGPFDFYSPPQSPQVPGPINLGDVWVMGASNDGVIVSYTTQ